MEISIQQHVSLKPYNSFGLDVSAQYFVTITSQAQLMTLLKDPRWQQTPKLILGGGSNILLTKDFQGLVIKIANQGIDLISEDKKHVTLKIAAGENWHKLVMHCIDRDYAGIENLSLIPGTVGAAPMQNIGAYGVELKESFVALTAIKISDASVHTFNHQDCQFAYRNSIFKHSHKDQYVIMDVTLHLNKFPTFHTHYGAITTTLEAMGIDTLSIKAVSDAIIHIRRQKLPDPANIGNAGSFFKNPVLDAPSFEKLITQYPDIPHYSQADHTIKVPAAWLIEQCGWKGKRFDHIGVHDTQPLVLVNHGAGSGNAIKELSEKIQASVQKTFDIALTPEVNII